MLNMSQITIDDESIDFNGIENIEKGTTIYISTGNSSVYIESKTSTKIENWLSLIVATYNVQEDESVIAVLDNKKITFNGATALEVDLGFENA